MLRFLVKLQKGGRLTIPAPIRHALNLKTGDLLSFKFYRGRIIVTPCPK
jgi:AbrB family looped-hinge helix DNA binding protein